MASPLAIASVLVLWASLVGCGLYSFSAERHGTDDWLGLDAGGAKLEDAVVLRAQLARAAVVRRFAKHALRSYESCCEGCEGHACESGFRLGYWLATVATV